MSKIKAKRRALYFYICAECGKKRDSLIYTRATDQVCSICRKNKVPENQPSLFTAKENKEQEKIEILNLIEKNYANEQSETSTDDRGQKTKDQDRVQKKGNL